jgi:lysine-N-methylase
MAATPSATSPCLAEIRAFTFLLLQDRAYPLWQRLFLLGLFCRRLQTILDAGFPGSIPSLIANYAQVAASGALRSQMSAIPAHPGSQLAIILSFLNMRLTGTLNSLRFLECGKQFLDGIQYRPGTAPEDLAPAYTEAFERYYEPLMRSQPYMMENYLLNHVFKSVFPYGKAAAVETLTPSNPNDPNDPKDRNLTQSPAAPSVFREYLILCAHHALIKGLLIGMAGFHRENFGPDHVVRLVQSYGRMIEHHGAFPAETVAFLEAQSLANPSGIAMLLRNQGL